MARSLSQNNDSSDAIGGPVKDILYPFISLCVLVGFIGIVANVALVVIVIRKRLFKQSVFQLVGNLAVVEIVRCLVVLPFLLTTMLVKDWIFGSFLCFVFPVLLPCTIHVSVFGLLSIFIFRFLKVIHNIKSPIPAWTCIVTSWLLSIAILTPHAAFTRYVDLQPLRGPDYAGVGICLLRPGAEEKNKEYVLSIFFVFYIALFVTVMVLAVFIHVWVKSRESEFPPPMNSFSMEMNIRVGEKEDEDEDNLRYPNSAMLKSECEDLKEHNSDIMKTSKEFELAGIKPVDNENHQSPITARKAKIKQDRKMQKFIHIITISFALLWMPFYVHYQFEALAGIEEPTNYLLKMCLLLIGYLSSWSLPLSFSLWQMSTATKSKLAKSLNPKNWIKKSNK